jgi:hypothetical protein
MWVILDQTYDLDEVLDEFGKKKMQIHGPMKKRERVVRFVFDSTSLNVIRENYSGHMVKTSLGLHVKRLN